MQNLKRFGLGATLVFLVACSHHEEKKESSSSSSSGHGRYQGKDKDWGPDREIDMSHVPDAVPKLENRTIAGNKNPYTVLGKTYWLMDDERAYKERGTASWYGYKFNGERTSNGELYDMFSMTAAHKTLPIPSYVRVTNLDNRKTVVVRVNDRGPFHEDRIIDLSYAAAQRLGITREGTGRVEVEIVVPEDDPRPPLKARKPTPVAAADVGVVSRQEAGSQAVDEALPAGTYLQLAAFSSESSAKQLAASLKKKLSYPVVIASAASPHKVYRVRLGPFKSTAAIEKARKELIAINFTGAHVVYENR